MCLDEVEELLSRNFSFDQRYLYEGTRFTMKMVIDVLLALACIPPGMMVKAMLAAWYKG